MSDENKNKNENESGSTGCLAILIMLMAVVLVLTVLVFTGKLDPDTLAPGNPFERLQEVFQSGTDATEKPTDQTPVPTGDTQRPTQSPTEPSVKPSTQPPTEPPTEPTTAPEPEPVAMRVVVQTQARSAAAEDAGVIKDLDRGTVVEVLETEKGYCRIRLEGQICYVPAEYLREVGEYLVVIDAGHQAQGNNEHEPIGPGAQETKPKVSSGTQGVATGIEEYKLNLRVAKKLQTILESRGYQVKMVRTGHDVDLSNSQRAAIANECYADAFIRIHANGDSDPNVQGIMTLCQTAENPYNGSLYAQSRRLSDCVLNEMVAATDAVKQFVWETDTMSGINWCQVPVTIVEMGYMSNPGEDRRLATDEYQQKLAQGIANGIDSYFE